MSTILQDRPLSPQLPLYMRRPPERKAYQPIGAALAAWRSRSPEVLCAGPADTGKSRGWLEKFHYCANKYPRARLCIVRKTRKALTQSAIVTYEQKVLPEGALGKGYGQIQWRSTEQEYRYPNGSIIAVSGLDDPEKLKSSEWDMLYFQEATEGSENDWELMTRGLRNGAMPYQQLGADCNPSYPFHWLKRRCERGATLMLAARHEDNPSVTPERLALLQALTGVRYLRLYKGLWVAAEGIVYPEWDPAVHKVSREELIRRGVFYTNGTLNRQVIRHVYGGADWGFSNPGVLSIYGIDGDSRMYLLKEIYRTQKTIDWWIPQAQALAREFGIERWVADPSRPDYITQFNMAGLPTEGATNAIRLGIDFLRTRLRVAGDGMARYFVYEYANTDPDSELERVFKPTGIEQEFELYVWPTAKEGHPMPEVPVDEHNHALDTARYVAAALDESGAGEGDREIAETLISYRGY